MLCGIFRAVAHGKRMTFDGINYKNLTRSYTILRDLTRSHADLTRISAYIPA